MMWLVLFVAMGCFALGIIVGFQLRDLMYIYRGSHERRT